jgi:hypothetical protein
MRVKQWVRFSVIPATLVAAGIAFASSGGPPRQRTGAPAIGSVGAESTCLGCHSGNPINGSATLTFVNAPNFYVAGQTYTFSVQLASTATSGNANRVWSFELTAVNMGTGAGAGTFTNVAGQGTAIISGSGSYSTRRYIEEASNDKQSAASPVTWQVQWTAPDPGVGSVGFYAAGIAGNGNGQTSGDYVATASQVMADVTPTEQVTWGRVKSLFR